MLDYKTFWFQSPLIITVNGEMREWHEIYIFGLKLVQKMDRRNSRTLVNHNWLKCIIPTLLHTRKTWTLTRIYPIPFRQFRFYFNGSIFKWEFIFCVYSWWYHRWQNESSFVESFTICRVHNTCTTERKYYYNK